MLQEAVPVVNEHAARLDYLKTAQDAASAHITALEAQLASHLALTPWQRLKSLLSR